MFNNMLGLQREIYSPIELIYMINCMEDYIFRLVVGVILQSLEFVLRSVESISVGFNILLN